MSDRKTLIDDPWTMERTGLFSNSFSDFLAKLASKMPKEKKQKLEKAAKILGPEGVNELGVPEWIKPFTAKILQQVSKNLSSQMAKIPGDLFGTGIFTLGEALHKVAIERGIKNEAVLRLVKMLPEFEALMYFLNVRKYYRDHCAHQLRVAILGDFLLDLKSEAGELEGVARERLGMSAEELRTAWWFTGLLHDTGIPLAKLCTAVNWSLINEILRCYSSLGIRASPMAISLSSEELGNREFLSVLAKDMPKQWQEALERGLGDAGQQGEAMQFDAGYGMKSEYNPRNLHLDHGAIGAINLLRSLGTPDRLRKCLPEDRPLIEAAKAMAVHNLKNELGTVQFEEFPLAFLLILTDELQEWSRPIPVPIKDTYFTTSLEKVTLLNSISYDQSTDLWDIPYENMEAKKLANFDFKRLCGDKKDALKILDCTEQFPESEVQLRNPQGEKPKKEEKFVIKIKTK